MRISPHLRATDAKEMSHQGERAFTMVEIAIAIGVIGFALVAIIGILPTGMNVQKDNREDSVISQDAPYFLDAIRNGTPVTNGLLAANNGYSAQGLDFLTNYVQLIQFINYSNGVVGTVSNYTGFVSGASIIGLLSTPQNNYGSPYFYSNYFDVVAYVRALSGPASAQQFAAGGPSSFMAFTYKMEVFISPFNSFAPATINYGNPNLDANQSNICYNRWLEATPSALAQGGQLPLTTPVAGAYPGYPQGAPITPAAGALVYNLFDVRLRFSWPVLMEGTNVVRVGQHYQTYRTLVAEPLSAASVLQAPNNTVTGWFFQPQQPFATGAPNNL
jgi:type II secretory pathway pseudopilin PulG